jgi:hypothetical protein
MSDAKDDVHAIPLPEAIPEPGTMAMVMLLTSVMEGVAGSVPFPFTCVDLMSAHLKGAFEVGLMYAADPQSLRDTLVGGLDAILADVLEQRGKLH